MPLPVPIVLLVSYEAVCRDTVYHLVLVVDAILQMVKTSGCQCQNRNSPGVVPSILGHGGI
jgi:hypothetical protein